MWTGDLAGRLQRHSKTERGETVCRAPRLPTTASGRMIAFESNGLTALLGGLETSGDLFCHNMREVKGLGVTRSKACLGSLCSWAGLVYHAVCVR